MGLIKSFGHAFAGVIYVLKSERNARIHLVAAVLVVALGLALNMSGLELAAICFAVLIVFLAEVYNTAMEKTLDLVQTKNHPQIKIVKDMAAGSVLVAALMAAIIGAVVFKPYVLEWLWLPR